MSTSPTDTPFASVPFVMPAVTTETEFEIDYESLVTEDHKPVDRIFIEKLYRLLTRPLYASWSGPGAGRPFLVLTDVGWFYQHKTPAVVADCLLSLDVTGPKDLQVKQGHSYYQWDMGKQPDVVIEVVSDKLGGEESFKKDLYARLGVSYYAVYDPKHILSEETLRVYELVAGVYRHGEPGPWPAIGLGLRLWQGKFEGFHDSWLRWCDASGEIIPTGEERAVELAEQAKLADERARLADDRARLADDRARLADERSRELEAELRRLKGEPPA